MACGRSDSNFKSLIKCILWTKFMSTSCKIALGWMHKTFLRRQHCLNGLVPSGNKPLPKAQVTLCRSAGPNLYDLKNRGHRHGRLMKSWQHRTDILEVCSVGKRSAVIGKPVRQSFTVKFVVLVVTVATIYSWIDFSRVWNRKRRGTVVPSVRAFVDSVWAFVDSVWAFVDSVRMVVKIGPI